MKIPSTWILAGACAVLMLALVLPSFLEGQSKDRAILPFVPKGAILMWSGKLIDIPVGYALCDGLNGTPDLRGRFVLSVPDGATDPGFTGGSTAHEHGPGTFAAADHTHAYSGTTAASPYHASTNSGFTLDVAADNHQHQYQGVTDVGGGAPITGTSSTESHVPPFYELAFIMKL